MQDVKAAPSSPEDTGKLTPPQVFRTKHWVEMEKKIKNDSTAPRDGQLTNSSFQIKNSNYSRTKSVLTFVVFELVLYAVSSFH